MKSRTLIVWSILLILAGCGSHPAAVPAGPLVDVTTNTRPFAHSMQPCEGKFVPHALDYRTIMDDGSDVWMFDTNGAGLAINDLDNDGRLDLVLANLRDQNAIFWNQGSMAFRREDLAHGSSRAVSAVDVNGDGWQDLVFTRRVGRPTYWQNQRGQFVMAPLPGVYYPAYAMTWADLDGDGRLDLVTGSYDAALEQLAMTQMRSEYGTRVGVYVYMQRDGSFVPQQLAPEAQALALIAADVNDDGRPDLLVGNDFDTPDYTWLRTGDGWQAVELFANTSRNTMSLDAADTDNNGSLEIFATDMKPYDQSVQTLAAWLPMMKLLPRPPSSEGPQINENTLQVRRADGRFDNQAYERMASATGWSWSGKFGDLDNDGFVDLYVVNGMVSSALLGHLAGHELIEQNQVLHNDGNGRFIRVPEWGLGSTAGGRGMSMADLDEDGDLDVVVNNLGTSAQIFENRLCGGSSLEIDLDWPGSKNRRAIGARVVLRTSAGSYYRDVRAGSGYLSGDPARIHIGFPASAVLQRLEIIWPDGNQSVIADPPVGALVTVTR